MANDLPECRDIKVQSIVHLVGTGLTDLAKYEASNHNGLQQAIWIGFFKPCVVLL